MTFLIITIALLSYLAGKLSNPAPESPTNQVLLHAQTELHLLRTGLHQNN